MKWGMVPLIVVVSLVIATILGRATTPAASQVDQQKCIKYIAAAISDANRAEGTNSGVMGQTATAEATMALAWAQIAVASGCGR